MTPDDAYRSLSIFMQSVIGSSSVKGTLLRRILTHEGTFGPIGMKKVGKTRVMPRLFVSFDSLF